MFEILHQYVVTDGEAGGPNRFWPVSEVEIRQQEERLGFRFPTQIRSLLAEAGSGTIKAKAGLESVFDARRFNFINRFLDPVEMVDLYLGFDIETAPEEGFGEGELPFFEVGDQEYFVIRPEEPDPNRVYMALGGDLGQDLATFVKSLLHDPVFYLEIGR